MLAEMSSKEQIYFLEFAQFLPLTNLPADPVLIVTAPGATAGEVSTQFWPSDPGTSTFDSVRVGTAATSLPKSWLYLAVRPKDTVLYCTYLANAGRGDGAGSAPASGTLGAQILGNDGPPPALVLRARLVQPKGHVQLSRGVTTFRPELQFSHGQDAQRGPVASARAGLLVA